MTTKVCIKCNIEKDLVEFNKDKRRADGLFPYCRTCRSIMRKWRYATRSDNEIQRDKETKRKNYLANRRKYLNTQKKYYDPVAKREYDKEYVRKNYDKKRKYAREYYVNNSEKIKRRVREYNRFHQKEVAMWSRRKRERKMNSGGETTTQEIEWLKQMCDNSCLCCGSNDDLTIDHIIPLISGGDGWLYNLQILCRSCNSSKRDKIIDYRPGELIMSVKTKMWRRLCYGP